MCDSIQVTGPQYADKDVLRGLGTEQSQHIMGAVLCPFSTSPVLARLQGFPCAACYRRVSHPLLRRTGKDTGQPLHGRKMEATLGWGWWGDKAARLTGKKPMGEEDGKALLMWAPKDDPVSVKGEDQSSQHQRRRVP